MALAAGHYVVHLAYERKGFGAFNDLGLEDYVRNVNDFDAKDVQSLIQALTSSEAVRNDYDTKIQKALSRAKTSTDELLTSIRGARRPS